MGSWLFGNSASANNPAPPASALRMQTSMQGRPIPIMWGTSRLAGNIIWNGDFAATANFTSVGSNDFIGHIFSKAQSVFTGFTYTASIAFALANGPISAVLRAWNGTTSTTAAGLGFVTLPGDYAQDPWPGFDTGTPLAYRGVAYVAAKNFALGSSPDIPIFNWEVQTSFIGHGPTSQDANPKDVLDDILTNLLYGINFPPERVGDWTSYGAYALAAGLVVSPALLEQVSAQQFISDLLTATNSSPRWSSGKLTIVPWGTSTIINGTVTTTPGNGDLNSIPAIVTGQPSIQVKPGQFVANVAVVNSSTFNPYTFVPYATYRGAGNAQPWDATKTYAAGQYASYIDANNMFAVYLSRVGSNTGNNPSTSSVQWMPSLLDGGQYTVTPGGLYIFSVLDVGFANIYIKYQYASVAAYFPDTAPIYDLTADDFQPNQGSAGTGNAAGNQPVIYVRKRKSNMLNQVKTELLDRGNNYDPSAIDATDEGSVVTFGLRPSSLKTRHMFCIPDAASLSAYCELIREQIPGTFTFTLNKKFILPDVEDVVTLTSPAMGLNRQACRIVEIQENADRTFTYTAEEYIDTVAAPIYGSQAPSGVSMNLLADPGAVADALIFEPGATLAATPTGFITLYAAVSGADHVNYGGSNVYYSTDNVVYTAVGIAPPAQMGFSNNALPSHADPDNTNTLSVNLSESAGVLPPGSTSNSAIGIPPCWLDGELISYALAALFAANNYNLTGMKRGGFGSSISAHVAGASFALIDKSIFAMNVPSALAGATVYFKFQPYNIFLSALPDISTLPVHPYTIGSAPVVVDRGRIDNAPTIDTTAVIDVNANQLVEPDPVALV